MFFKRINEIHLQISFRARATTVLDDNSIIKRIFIDKQSLKKGFVQVSSIQLGYSKSYQMSTLVKHKHVI